MQKKKTNYLLLIFSIIFYIIAGAAMIYGTANDIEIDMKLFNPESALAINLESFGQIVYWGIWGPAITIVFLCRRDLNGCLGVINKVFPFIKPVKNVEAKAYKVFNFILNVILTLGFFVLAMVGWKKIIENVIKNILLACGKEDLPQVVYFVGCTIFTAIIVFLCRNIDKEKLRKIESLALAGILLGITYKLVEECKEITCRVRFREMVAYSNNFLNEKGLSEGKHSPLTRDMASNTDFSAFTPWYKKGDDMGIYNRADSFPSGHTTYSFSLFLSYILFNAYDKLKKYAPITLVVGVIFSAIMAVSRMIAGAHYLTDVAGAALIGYTLFLVVNKLYKVFTDKGIIG